MKIKCEFFAERRAYGNSIALHLTTKGIGDSGAGYVTVAQPVVFTQIKEGDWAPPALEISPESAQDLMDELWRVGLRPTQGKQSEGQVDAILAHLQDMRAIVFSELEMPKP